MSASLETAIINRIQSAGAKLEVDVYLFVTRTMAKTIPFLKDHLLVFDILLIL
jgi:hypothetical protein